MDRGGGLLREWSHPPVRPERVHFDRAALPPLFDGIGVRERGGRADLCLRSMAPPTLGRDRRHRAPSGYLASEFAGGGNGPKQR